MIGCDKIGKFRVPLKDRDNSSRDRQLKRCGICEKQDQLCVVYTSSGLHVSSYIREAPSFLMRKGNKWIRTIGITCGCYSKVHRQMAHIESGESHPARGERRV